MSKKDLNPQTVINELKGQSVFFRPEPEQTPSPTVQPKVNQGELPSIRPKKPVVAAVENPNARTGERPERSERPDEGERPERPIKREIKRHSFEFYRDQLDRLQDLRIEHMKAGEMKSMSAIVREALDAFLDKQA